MSFNILAIVAEYATADPGLYPLPGGPIMPITPEPLDGPVAPLSADRLVVTELGEGRDRELIKLRKVNAEVLITDQRVAVVSTDYGRLLRRRHVRLLMPEQAVELGLRRRRRNRVLLGHVRYQWLSAVGFQTRSVGGRAERLRLRILDGSAGPVRSLALDIDLSASRAAEVAQHIVRRAARFCLAHVPLPHQYRPELEQLTRAEPLTVADGPAFTCYRLPYALEASEATAILPSGGLGATRVTECTTQP